LERSSSIRGLTMESEIWATEHTFEEMPPGEGERVAGIEMISPS